MTFNELTELVFDGLPPVLSQHPGVQLYAMEREKFDCWLTVELCRLLVQAGIRPDPSEKKIDLSFGRWALDVRTVSTNIPHDACRSKARPVKKQIDDLIKEIWKLTNPGKTTAAIHRAMLLLVYPTEHENERWQSVHFPQLRSELTEIAFRELHLRGDIPAVLYLGLCSET